MAGEPQPDDPICCVNLGGEACSLPCRSSETSWHVARRSSVSGRPAFYVEDALARTPCLIDGHVPSRVVVAERSASFKALARGIDAQPMTPTLR